MSTTLNGKVAVVTGASKGIGAGIAKSLAAAGAIVTVNYASDKSGAEKTVNQIISDGGRAIAVQGSVASEADVRKLFDETIKNFGHIDILVNNAGVYSFSSLEEITREEYERQFNTNVWGVMLASREAIKHFPATGGNIINISSVVSRRVMPNVGIYASTKGALDTLGEVLAIELAPKNIRVNTVAPGLVETEGVATAGIKDSDFETNAVATTPLARLGQPDDIARVVTFLASDEAAWLTGERINASGGFH